MTVGLYVLQFMFPRSDPEEFEVLCEATKRQIVAGLILEGYDFGSSIPEMKKRSEELMHYSF